MVKNRSQHSAAARPALHAASGRIFPEPYDSRPYIPIACIAPRWFEEASIFKHLNRGKGRFTRIPAVDAPRRVETAMKVNHSNTAGTFMQGWSDIQVRWRSL
jgi:hypothetical protein